MKKHNTMFVILMAVLFVFGMGGGVMAMDSYVELGTSITDRGNSDFNVENSMNIGAGVSQAYGNVTPYARMNLDLDASGLGEVVSRNTTFGVKYAISDSLTVDGGYNIKRYPTMDSVNQLKFKIRKSF